MLRSLPTDALDYELPPALVAAQPAEPRHDARLLVLRRSGGELEHRRARDLPEYLGPDDLLVFNQTAVAPARLVGRRVDTGGAVEGLFLGTDDRGAWRVLLKPSRRLRPGVRIELLAAGDTPAEAVLELVARDAEVWTGRPETPRPPLDLLGQVGRTPLPPYILRARQDRRLSFDDARDRAWYQTVYADPARCGSVAAPTAGLHFTPELLEAVEARGARRTGVTLHVGPGTFRPIATATVEAHPMHRESYEVPPAALAALRDAALAREAGTPSRVIAVGTTTVRTLESLPAALPAPSDGPVSGDTDLLIAPGHRFRHVDGLLTNFHLPRSTLLALVAAMIGLDRLLAVYEEAIRREYRFYSYGDAMLVLP